VKHVEAQRFTDPDTALEWAETALLASHGLGDELPEGLVPLAHQDLLRDLAPDVVAEIESRTRTQVFHAGTVLFEEGAEADGLYFIGAGQVSADIRTRSGPRRRLSTIAAGSSFGELALVDGLPRSTRISALEPTICFILSPEGYAELHEQAPAACAELTRAIARSLSQRLRYSTADVAAFEEA
jgi:glutaminase